MLMGRIAEIGIKGQEKFNKSLVIDIKGYLGIDFESYDLDNMKIKVENRLKILKYRMVNKLGNGLQDTLKMLLENWSSYESKELINWLINPVKRFKECVTNRSIPISLE